jgi:hypothetical protein
MIGPGIAQARPRGSIVP